MKKIVISSLILVVIIILTASFLSAGNNNYRIEKFTVNGGGISMSTDTAYTVNATQGQFDAGQLTSCQYIVGGGYWASVKAGFSCTVFFPLITTQDGGDR